SSLLTHSDHVRGKIMGSRTLNFRNNVSVPITRGSESGQGHAGPGSVHASDFQTTNCYHASASSIVCSSIRPR
ncbi:hypothetical protein AB205_0188600, partial [Aquarana catesbeiana]